MTFLHFIYTEFSAISATTTTTTITIITTSTRVLNITSSTVLKDNNDNNDNNKQEIKNDTATGLIIVVIIIVSMSLLYSVYICVKRIKEGDITHCCDAVSGLLYFFIPFFGIIYNDVIDKVSVKAETLKKTLTFFLVILSILSVFFLSKASGFTNELNGSIVIFCSINCLCLSCCRAAIHCKMTDKSDTKYEGREGSSMYALMIGSLSDAMFDLIQGLALYLNQMYTNNAFSFFLSASIIGATEEIIDLILELCQTAKTWYEGSHKFVDVFISLAIAFEIGTSIYLAAFYPIALQTIAIIIKL